MKRRNGSHTGALQKNLRHSFTAVLCKPLAYFDIVQVVLKICAVEIAQICRNCRLLCLPLLLHCFQSGLNFCSAALLLICAYQLISLFKVTCLSVVKVDCQLLIILCDLLTQIIYGDVTLFLITSKRAAITSLSND